MSVTVTLVTDRPTFAPVWRDALQRHDFAMSLREPASLGRFPVQGTVVVFDAAADGLDEDDLLSGVGYVRAAGGVAVVYVEGEIEPIVEEICAGCVARSPSDVDRVARNLARRLDADRAKRFEFVTVAPSDDEILAILGDGHSTLVKRPLGAEDDGSEVVAIALADDATHATLELQSGAELVLHVESFGATHTNGASMPIDGARLGARLRALRLEAGLTQAELARRTGIHRPNIARVEAGRHTPSLETLTRLATAIGVPATRVLAAEA